MLPSLGEEELSITSGPISAGCDGIDVRDSASDAYGPLGG